jgi:hypothetical protein
MASGHSMTGTRFGIPCSPRRNGEKNAIRVFSKFDVLLIGENGLGCLQQSAVAKCNV